MIIRKNLAGPYARAAPTTTVPSVSDNGVVAGVGGEGPPLEEYNDLWSKEVYRETPQSTRCRSQTVIRPDWNPSVPQTPVLPRQRETPVLPRQPEVKLKQRRVVGQTRDLDPHTEQPQQRRPPDHKAPWTLQMRGESSADLMISGMKSLRIRISDE